VTAELPFLLALGMPETPVDEHAGSLRLESLARWTAYVGTGLELDQPVTEQMTFELTLQMGFRSESKTEQTGRYPIEVVMQLVPLDLNVERVQLAEVGCTPAVVFQRSMLSGSIQYAVESLVQARKSYHSEV
jgi:hypothetical protein